MIQETALKELLPLAIYTKAIKKPAATAFSAML